MSKALRQTTRSILLLVLFSYCHFASAQTELLQDFRNPVAGYVVTQTGDTLRGTVDYRSDRENGLLCRFVAQDETMGKEYYPSDIAAYGTTSDGVLYVSRSLPVDGAEQTVFAEMLVRGCVTLYRHRNTTGWMFILEDASGKVATVPGNSFTGYSPDEALRLKREAYREATSLLLDSSAALELLWQSEATATGMATAVQRYNDDVCPKESDNAMTQRRPASSFHPQLLIEAGWAGWKGYGYDDDSSDRHSGAPPVLGIGLESSMPRLMPGLALQAMLRLRFGKYEWAPHNVLPELGLGAGYTVARHQKVRPVLIAGALASVQLMGPYAGCAVDFTVGSTNLRLATQGSYLVDMSQKGHVLMGQLSLSVKL